MKIVFIGASYKFVVKVVNDMIITGKFNDCEIVVVDVVQEPLDIVVDACRKLIADRKCGMTARGSQNRTEALENADFVLIAIVVGGFEAWKNDIDICSRYGVYHVIGDTIGPAALSRSLRTVPVMLDIARDVEKICPLAWVINITNPMTTSVKALNRDSKIKAAGFCNGAKEVLAELAALCGVELSCITCMSMGVNHLTFAADLRIKGSGVSKQLRGEINDIGGISGDCRIGMGLDFMRMTGWLPLIDDIHLVEFFPYYINNTCSSGKKYGKGPLDLKKRIELRNVLEQRHKDIVSGKLQLYHDRYSDEDIHEILLSLYYGQECKIPLNIMNKGCCPGLREDTVVEIPAAVSKDIIQGIKIEKGVFDDFIISLVNNINTVYDCTVEAAAGGDTVKAEQALLLDPMMQGTDVVHVIPKMLGELIEANKKYLPLFA